MPDTAGSVNGYAMRRMRGALIMAMVSALVLMLIPTTTRNLNQTDAKIDVAYNQSNATEAATRNGTNVGSLETATEANCNREFASTTTGTVDATLPTSGAMNAPPNSEVAISPLGICSNHWTSDTAGEELALLMSNPSSKDNEVAHDASCSNPAEPNPASTAFLMDTGNTLTMFIGVHSGPDNNYSTYGKANDAEPTPVWLMLSNT